MILVTGCEGFIGKAITNHYIGKGECVIGVDKCYHSMNHNLKEYICARLDDSYSKLKEIDTPNIIFHCAANVGVKNFNEFTKAYQNTLIDSNIFEYYLRYCPTAKFVYCSTSEVYGNSYSMFGLKEDSDFLIPNCVRSTYAIEKLHFENCLQTMTTKYLILRLFNIFGKDQNSNQGVISSFFDSCINDKPLYVYCDKDKNTYKRAYCHIDDCVNAIDALIQNDETGIFNIGNPENYYSNIEVAEMFLKEFKVPIEYLYTKDIINRLPNIDKLKHYYIPKIKLEDYIHDLSQETSRKRSLS